MNVCVFFVSIFTLGVSGFHCEEPSYGFEELSYMEFPPLDRRMNSIHLEFATLQRKSLLIYNPGGSTKTEFFALEILDGVVRLSYDLGAGPVRLKTHKQVADGQFHSVDVKRIGNMGSMSVDNCTEEDKSGFCVSMSEGSMSERTLDVGNGNLTVGGLKTTDFLLLHPAHIQTHDFVGCIQNFQINGNQVRPSMSISSYNILNRCPRSAVSPCHSLPCVNGGVCHDLWSDYFCECKSPYAGKNCAQELSGELVMQLNGSDYIEYVVKDRVKREHLLKYSINDSKDGNNDQTAIDIKFKTEDDGVLFFVLGRTGYIMLVIRDKRPVYISKDVQSGDLSEVSADHAVADGKWHVLSMFSSETNSSVTVDGKVVLNTSEHGMNLTPVNVEKIILGAGPKGGTEHQQLQGFSGCLQSFTISGYTLPISGHGAMADVWSTSTLFRSNCSSPGVCLPSPPDENGSCVCLYNVSDDLCSICKSTSQSHRQCSEVQSSEPLWIVALVLPLITTILLAIGVFVCLFKLRPWDSKSLPQKTDQGTDNRTFCLDSASQDKVEPHELVAAAQERSSVEVYVDGTPSSVEPVSKSELEYYEVGSAFHSDASSLKLSWHKHFDHSQSADFRMLLAGVKKENTTEKETLTTPRDGASLNRSDTKQREEERPRNVKRSLRAELLEPIQHLTFEEISRLNSPVGQTMSDVPNKSKDLQSESETDSTFTQSASEQLSVVRSGNVFEQWEHFFNFYLPYSSYAPVFEEIACLPINSGHMCDVQSDIEEII